MVIVKRFFTALQFRNYVDMLNLKHAPWRGQFIVLHNTSAPTLAQRPNGLTNAHMDNLRTFYEGKGWHAGPHLFIDDHGIWAFSPLTAPGVHSPSWNHVSYGIEQLGEYDTEAYDTGRGALVRANAVAAVAVLSHAVGIDSHSLRLHKEDPETNHKDCPGINCAREKAALMYDVHAYILRNLS